MSDQTRRTANAARRRFFAWRSWRLWTVVFNVIIVALLFSAHKWPLVKVRSVAIAGPECWHERAQELVTVPSDSNLFGVDCDGLEHRLNREFGALAACRVKLSVTGVLHVDLKPNRLALWTENRNGVGIDGSLIAQPQDEGIVPVWRVTARDGLHQRRWGARRAAAAWAAVLAGDPRWEAATSEWACTDKGWQITTLNGKTAVMLGWEDIAARARSVARLLTRSDSILTQPCTIDARFDGQLIVRPRAEEEHVS
jgi:cell division septal protein FtsQ